MRKGPKPINVGIFLILSLIVLGFVFAALQVTTPEKNNILQEHGSVNVYFCQTQDCATAFTEAMLNATNVRCAFYELNYPDIIQALDQVNASVLVYSENYNKTNNSRIVPVVSKGLMHDKFCIFEKEGKSFVVTGSMNPTFNDVKRNDNNLLIIQSETFAARYSKEFNELSSRKNVNYKKNPSAPIMINLSGVVIEQHFCPQEACEDAVLNAIDPALHEVDFMLFTFTSDNIGNLLLKAHEQGVYVNGVIEKRNIDQWSEYQRLLEEHVPVYKDGNKYTMHHKVFIIDNQTVITGSFNPTASANEKNDENLLIIHDQNIAMLYRNEFVRVNAAAQGLGQHQ